MKNAKKKVQKLAQSIELLRAARGPAQRREALEKAIVAAGGTATQAGRGYAYMLAKENLLDFAGVAAELGTNVEAQPRAIAAASGPSIRTALGPAQRPSSARISDPRQSLRDVYTGDYRRESLPVDQTELESQTRIREAEVNLQKAETPEARAEWGMRLTKERLVLGHRRGEI